MIPTTITIIFRTPTWGKEGNSLISLTRKRNSPTWCCGLRCAVLRGPASARGVLQPVYDSVALGGTASASSILFNTLVRPATHYSRTILPFLSLSFRMAVLTDVHELSARSLSSSLTPNATQRTTLIVAGCYIIIIGILWYALFSLPLPSVHY